MLYAVAMSAIPKTFPEHELANEEQLQSGIEVIDERFRELVSEVSEVRRHWKGAEWSEGAVYLPQQNIIVWSDIPNNRMLQFDPESNKTTVFREPSNFTNGNTIDREGRLVTATHLTHCVSRPEHDGSITILVDRYNGKRLNSPNDVVVKSDGTIWFTDPPYGILSNREGEKRDSELEGNFVYRLDPETSDLSIVANSMDRPNGLGFSPDESRLYVSDTGLPGHISLFDVKNCGTRIQNQREFVKLSPGVSDGFRCDVQGNVWTSAGDGIQCFSPDATLLGKILIPELRCANCCFGGPDRKTLYVAGDTSLYSVELAVAGASID